MDISIAVICALILVAAFLLTHFIPMPSWVAGILWGLAVLAIIVIVTRALGIRTGLAMLTL